MVLSIKFSDRWICLRFVPGTLLLLVISFSIRVSVCPSVRIFCRRFLSCYKSESLDIWYATSSSAPILPFRNLGLSDNLLPVCRLSAFLHNIHVHAKGKFFVTDFSVTSNNRALIFGMQLHLVLPYYRI